MDFEAKLHALVAGQLSGTPEEFGMLIERLADSLGLAIAVASRGNAETADKLLTGAEGYVAEAVAHHSKLARFMAEMKRHRGGE